MFNFICCIWATIFFSCNGTGYETDHHIKNPIALPSTIAAIVPKTHTFRRAVDVDGSVGTSIMTAETGVRVGAGGVVKPRLFAIRNVHIANKKNVYRMDTTSITQMAFDILRPSSRLS